METLFFSRMPSLAGSLFIGASYRGLAVVHFERTHGDTPPATLGGKKIDWQESQKKLAPYITELEQYFAGKRRRFTFALDLRGTEFQRACWEALLAIPFGETRSYADIARAVGRPQGFRAVGMANHDNPIAIVVPCHRVLASDGTLCGYGGGLDVKLKLLELEGVELNPRSRQQALFS